MKQIYEDLWQTKLENPFAGVQTHAYYLQCPEGNVLIYNTGHTEEINHIAGLGGIKYHYLSHRDEAGPSLEIIRQRLGSELCCHENEKSAISQLCEVDITFSENTRHFSNVDIICTPGHTNGSISFLYSSPFGRTFLFTGDTLFQSNGRWRTLVLSDAGGSSGSLIESLQTYRDLNPDVVLSSASATGERAFVETTESQWKEDIDNTIEQMRN
ncbi:MAG: MBL fold metallo-hydrolase [Acidiferrobacterales bacterium]